MHYYGCPTGQPYFAAVVSSIFLPFSSPILVSDIAIFVLKRDVKLQLTSPILSCHRLDVYRISTYDVALVQI